MSQKSQPPTPQSKRQTSAAWIMERLGVYALVRTAFSSERSLLSWMRTTASMYSFGFSLIKFLDFLEKQQVKIEFSVGLHRLGIALIIVGILMVGLAAVEHGRRLRKMKELGLPTVHKLSLPIAIATVLALVGIATLVGILLPQSP